MWNILQEGTRKSRPAIIHQQQIAGHDAADFENSDDEVGYIETSAPDEVLRAFTWIEDSMTLRKSTVTRHTWLPVF